MFTVTERPTMTRGALLRLVLAVLTVLSALTFVPGCVRSGSRRAFLERENPVLAPEGSQAGVATASVDPR